MTFLRPTRSSGSDYDTMLRQDAIMRANGGFDRATTARAPEPRAASARATIESLMVEAGRMALDDRSMTKEQHFARLLKASPEIYNEYLRQNPAQTTGRR